MSVSEETITPCTYMNRYKRERKKERKKEKERKRTEGKK
jgi:hypothetical protein